MLLFLIRNHLPYISIPNQTPLPCAPINFSSLVFKGEGEHLCPGFQWYLYFVNCIRDLSKSDPMTSDYIIYLGCIKTT